MDHLNWTLSSQKLFKLQRKIQDTETQNPRLCRNFQRLLYRTSELQLFIIHKILQIQFKRLVEKKDIGWNHCWPISEPIIFQETRTIQEIIIFPKLISKEYRFFLMRQIMNILWVLALSPILKKKKKNQIILTGLQSSQMYKMMCTFLKKPLIHYIIISQFSNFLNKKNKFWILSNLLIEKKFFLHWLKSEKLGFRPIDFLSNTVQPWQFKSMSYGKTKKLLGKELPKAHPLSLKTILENFTTLNFINSYIPQVIKYKKQIQKLQFDHRLNNKIGVRKFWNKAFIRQKRSFNRSKLSAETYFQLSIATQKSNFRQKPTAFGKSPAAETLYWTTAYPYGRRLHRVRKNPRFQRDFNILSVWPSFDNFFLIDKIIPWAFGQWLRPWKKSPTRLQKTTSYLTTASKVRRRP